ncbi:WD40 repeat-like protein [Sistotremastrum suecicum HHB10207 ss-3]|uniref:WD40 repeat-like protein n=1 Tax=Sistotremastrum suecicum HHB10207 ss-3 TaxID=1314776 RepID=A0A166B0B3_9AGAM|nr:WD40 repeat-like protein [Sistotremastrum suecicum HHB10207 ss-3]
MSQVPKVTPRRSGVPVYSADFFKTYVHKVGLPFSVDEKPATWADVVTNPPEGGSLVQGQESSTLEFTSPPASIAFNNQETLLAVAVGHEVKVYNFPELTLHARSDEYLGDVGNIRFHPDGRRLAVAVTQRKERRLIHTVSIWDMDSPPSATPESVRSNVTAEIFEAARKSLQEQAGWTAEYLDSSGLQESLQQLIKASIITYDQRNRYTLEGTFPHDDPFILGGSLLLYAKDRSTLVARDMETKAEKWSYSHENAITWAGVSLDGSVLASVSWDHTVQLRDPRSGEHIRTLTGPTGQNWVAAFSPDSSLIACGSGDQKIHVWRVDTGEAVHTLTGPPGWIRSISFSPDGKHLAAGSGHATFCIFDVESGREEQKWQVDKSDPVALTFIEIRDVKYTRQGDKVGFKGTDSTITVYDQERNVMWEISRVPGTGHSGNFLFTSDGQTVISADADNKIRVWDLRR